MSGIALRLEMKGFSGLGMLSPAMKKNHYFLHFPARQILGFYTLGTEQHVTFFHRQEESPGANTKVIVHRLFPELIQNNSEFQTYYGSLLIEVIGKCYWHMKDELFETAKWVSQKGTFEEFLEVYRSGICGEPLVVAWQD